MTHTASVAQQGARFFVSLQEELTDRDTGNETLRRREFDFNKLLKGPASFIRLVPNNDCQLFFWSDWENKWNQFFEGTVTGRGLIANTATRITLENWQKIAVVGPVKTIITIYASRVPDTDGIGGADTS